MTVFHLQATLKRFVVLLSKGAKAPVDLCSARTEVERTGLKVSSLYFAQIKKKCGLDVGENFNLPNQRMRDSHNAHRRRKKRKKDIPES